MSSTPKPVIDLAAAVVQRADGHVLLAQRPQGKLSAGYWEFPGGKLDAGEHVEQALARELHEEIGIELDRGHLWLTYEYDYPDKRVRLHCFRVFAWHGTPHGREGQPIQWQDPAALSVGPLLQAHERMLRALQLPPVYAVTNAGKYGVAEFMTRLQQALQRGVRLIQVREPAMAPEQLVQFTRRVLTLARPYGARVLVNGDETLARRTRADGIHTSSPQLRRLRTRPQTRWWSVSCHNADDLAQASALGADFVLLSPVLPTPTHPEQTALGWDRFASLTRDLPVPVYALGGMQPELVCTALEHGGHGIALSRGVW